jgi:acyl-[acyl-carrier-protein]-phospholipid O-acyltransferase/long-chain-fatty-acid--[acyl-carrier-protein] ligase
MFKALLRVVLQFLYKVRVKGDFKIKQGDPTLIISNHQSFLDGLLIGVMLPIAPVFIINTKMICQPYIILRTPQF